MLAALARGKAGAEGAAAACVPPVVAMWGRPAAAVARGCGFFRGCEGQGGGPHLSRVCHLCVVVCVSSSSPGNFARCERVGGGLRDPNVGVEVLLVVEDPTDEIVSSTVAKPFAVCVRVCESEEGFA